MLVSSYIVIIKKATMNVYRKDNIRFDYNKYLDQISLTKGKEWISLSLTSFEIFLNIIKNSSDYEKIGIRQNGGDIELLCLMKNYIVTFTCKSFSTDIIFSETDGNEIRENIEIIKESLRKLKSVSNVKKYQLSKLKSVTSPESKKSRKGLKRKNAETQG